MENENGPPDKNSDKNSDMASRSSSSGSLELGKGLNPDNPAMITPSKTADAVRDDGGAADEPARASTPKGSIERKLHATHHWTKDSTRWRDSSHVMRLTQDWTNTKRTNEGKRQTRT